MESNFHLINAVKTFITQSSSTGYPILFVHGNSLSSETFSLQLSSELSQQFRLIAFDFPGHGKSEAAIKPEETYSVKGFSKFLNGVLKELKIESCVLVGHSLGGHASIESISSLPSVDGVMIFGTPPIGIPPAMDKMFLPNPAMGFAFTGNLSREEATILASAFSKNDIADEKIVEMILATDPHFRPSLGTSIGGGAFLNEVEIISKLSKPICIVHGSKDKLVNAEYFSSLTIPSLYKNRIHYFESAGHLVQMDCGEKLNLLIGEFVGSCRK